MAAPARRRRPHRVHHLSLWDSVDAIRAFAGHDIDAAVLYPEDARYLVGESTVTHYQGHCCIERSAGLMLSTWALKWARSCA